MDVAKVASIALAVVVFAAIAAALYAVLGIAGDVLGGYSDLWAAASIGVKAPQHWLLIPGVGNVLADIGNMFVGLVIAILGLMVILKIALG